MMITDSYQYYETAGLRGYKLKRGEALEENLKPAEMWFLVSKEIYSLSLKWL